MLIVEACACRSSRSTLRLRTVHDLDCKMFCPSQPGQAFEGMSLAVYSLMSGLVPVFEQAPQSFSEPKVLHVHLPSLQLFKDLQRIRALTDQSEPAEQEELTGAELLHLVLVRHVKAWV